MVSNEKALIVGTGPGLSASLARLFAKEGMQVAVAARNVEKLSGLASEIGGTAHQCDAADPASVEAMFAEVTGAMGEPDIVVYNASNRGGRGPVTSLDAEAVRQAAADGLELEGSDGTLDPDAIAETYLHVHRQHRSAWTWEVELRPWAENF